MAVELATAYVRLMPSARGFRAAVEKEIGPQLADASEKAATPAANRFGSKFTSAMKGHGRAAALGFAAAMTGAAIIGKAAVDAASDLEESQNKVNVVFREGADDINAWAKNASTKIGLSRQAALDAAGGFGNLFIQLGIGADQAAEMSTGMVNLSADFASFHNADITEVLNAQQAAFRGEYDALQRFVPTINAAAVEQKAMEMGLAASTKELDAQDKALATQALMMEGAGDAAGDFARTSDGLANRQRIMSAQFKDLQASLGRVLIPVMSTGIGVVSDLANGFISFGKWMGEHKPVLIGALAGVGAALVALAVASAPVITAGFGVAAAWIAAAAPFIAIGAAIAAAVAGLVYAYQNFDWFRTSVDAVVDALVAAGEWLVEAWKVSFDTMSSVVSGTVDVVKGVIEAGVEAFKKAWGPIETLFTIFKTVYVDPVIFAIKTLVKVVEETIKTGVTAFKLAWNGVEAIYTFFRDRVWTPLEGTFNTMKDTAERVIEGTVSAVKTAWDRIVGVYRFFRDEVFTPVMAKFREIRDKVGDIFGAAVDAVKAAWDRLAGIVKTPINLVIGFYNNGIRPVWNGIIGRINDDWKLGPVTELATGGRVPGTGNSDTVPALLTPGEFVITKKAAAAWGPGVLELLNRGPNGTVDPGIFGYATGGVVRSLEETQRWARKQEGKPYQFPMVGPDSFDCSGFTSALINFVLGLHPWSRRHSSGSVGSDRALKPGPGDANGLTIGARPPYQSNAQGVLVGHTAASVGNLNAEATPPRVRVGQTARGGMHGMFTERYHLPGFGGLSDGDKGIVSLVKSLLDLRLPNLGGPPMGDLLQKMIVDLPRTIFDWMLTKLPGVIVDGVKDAVGGFFKAVVPGLRLGGMVPGSGNRDTVPAMLTPGEFIVNKSAARWWGLAALERLNHPERLDFESYDERRRRPNGGDDRLNVAFNYYTREPTASAIAAGIAQARLAS